MIRLRATHGSGWRATFINEAIYVDRPEFVAAMALKKWFRNVPRKLTIHTRRMYAGVSYLELKGKTE